MVIRLAKSKILIWVHSLEKTCENDMNYKKYYVKYYFRWYIETSVVIFKGEVVLNGKTVLSNQKPGQVHPPNLITW